MSWLETIDRSEVTTVEDFIEYLRGTFGTVVAPGEKIKFLKHWKLFRKDNPHVDIGALVKTADWARETKRKIHSLTGIFYLVDQAHRFGAVPELDPHSAVVLKVESGIRKALEIEHDPIWRKRLILAQGSARKSALDEWSHSRAMA